MRNQPPPGVLPLPGSGGGGAWGHAPGCDGIVQPRELYHLDTR